MYSVSKPREAISLCMVNVGNILQVSTATRMYFAISTDYLRCMGARLNLCLMCYVIEMTKVFRLWSPEHMTWPRCTKSIWIHALIFRRPSLTYCYERLKNSFMSSWVNDLRNGHESSILRTYSLCKTNFGIEKYMKYISKPECVIAFSKLRASLHDLEIERGCYVRPKRNLNERLCMACHVIEQEHFVTGCINN